jgi:transcriptional regulator with XRE-family HTH domain
MPVHIGKLIQAEVENKRLTQKEFGALINRNEKTVPDIYERASMSVDLLITISAALNKDFLNIYYDEEPMKSIRNDEITKLRLQIVKSIEENKRLQRELQLVQNLIEAQKEIISFAKEQIKDYKLKLKDPVNKVANKFDNNKESETNPDVALEK